MSDPLSDLCNEFAAFKREVDREAIKWHAHARKLIIDSKALGLDTASGAIQCGDKIVESAEGRSSNAFETAEAVHAIELLHHYLICLTPILITVLLESRDEVIQAAVIDSLGQLHSSTGQKSCFAALESIMKSTRASDRLKTLAKATTYRLKGDSRRFRQSLPPDPPLQTGNSQPGEKTT